MNYSENSFSDGKIYIDIFFIIGTQPFQIEFFAENTVRLYVDGNDIRTNLGGIKTSILNLSKTSADENKTESEIDNAYLSDTIPNDALKEDIAQEKATDIAYLQSSSDDIKHILGIPTEDVTLQRDAHKNFECAKSDTDKEEEKDVDETVSSGGDIEIEKANVGNEKSEDVSKDTSSQCEDVSESSNTDIIQNKATFPNNEADIISEKIKKNTDEEKIECVKSDIETDATEGNEKSEDIKSQNSQYEHVIDSSNSIKDKATLSNNEIDIISEGIGDACQKLVKSAPGSPERHVSSNGGNLLSDSLAESEVAIILKDAVEKALSKKDSKNRSRPASSCSGKINHDDRIVPGGVSRPHSPLQGDVESEGKVKSRPASACSGKISHDERIVPGALSRPQSPILSDDIDGQEAQSEK